MVNKLTPVPDHLRKEIPIWIGLDYEECFGGNIDDIINRLQKFKEDGVISINVKVDYDSTSFYLVKKRLETDKEYRARVKREEQDRMAQEKYKKQQEAEDKKLKTQRKKLYLELKKEFGDE
jgi:hypothetical protein